MNNFSQGSQVPKRLTDTEKWKKPFFRKLAPHYKLLWQYVLDDCDHAGVWQADFDIASIRVGTDIDPDEALLALSEQIHAFDDGEKWFIKDFCAFQYVRLKPGHKVHGSALKILDKYGLTHLVQDLIHTEIPSVDPDKIEAMNKEAARLYDLYPSKSVGRARVGKSKKDLVKMVKVMAEGYPLGRAIKEIALTSDYPKDLGTFLNNLPDLEATGGTARGERAPEEAPREHNKEYKGPVTNDDPLTAEEEAELKAKGLK